MQDLILAGSSGCMRELVWQIQELNKITPTWNIVGYVDYLQPEDGIGVNVGNEKILYLGTDETLLEMTENINVAICVGMSSLRKKIAQKFMQNPNIHFPNIILSNAYVCEDAQIGQGCIISMDCRISTNVTLGDFVFLNTGSMICHDGTIGEFVTLSPDVKLAGAVKVASGCELGIGSKVIQGISICENVIVGAGAVVIRDVEEAGTVVGVPARKIK